MCQHGRGKICESSKIFLRGIHLCWLLASSFHFLVLSSFFIFLFFFLQTFQIFLWKCGKVYLFKGVLVVYKVCLLRSFLFLQIFSLSYRCSRLWLFLDVNVWFNWGPSFYVDLFSLVFFFFALMVSWSIMEFGKDYITDETRVGKFLFYLIVFLLLIFILVFSGNFLILFVGWEGVRLLSFLLISWWRARVDAGTRSIQAVFYNRVGDARLLLFLVVSMFIGNGLFIRNSFASIVLFLLFFMRVVAKSSQLRFHPWLPNAIEGPTPVSSLLHSSTIVIARVYLIMRAGEYFDYDLLIFFVRIFTCIIRGFIGINHADFKKVVAYSTTSQLGFMIIILRIGERWLCLLYIIIHAFFKAIIFIISRVVIHISRRIQDFRNIFNSLIINNLLFFFYILGRVVIIRFPFLSRFWIKDIVLEGVGTSYFGVFTWVCFCISVLLTGVYSIRLYMGIFITSLLNQYKNFVINSLVSLYPYIRLFFRSVSVRVFIYFFYRPFSHFLLRGVDKRFALVVFVFGVRLAWLMLRVVKRLTQVFGRYLLHFNPVSHKSFSSPSYKVRGIVRLLDFLFVEFVFYGRIKISWAVLLKARLLLFFLLVIRVFFLYN